MFKHSLKIRFVALFVVTFVCLNAGGAACVAYCRTSDDLTSKVEHCPLKKIESHCDGVTEEGSDLESIGSNKVDCCPMTVSFFGAPIEKPSFRNAPAVAASIVDDLPSFPRVIEKRNVVQLERYRGPPPLDRRSERIKHRLLLI